MDAALMARLEAIHNQAAENSARLSRVIEQARALCRHSRDRRLDRAVLRTCQDPVSGGALLRSAQEVIANQEAWAQILHELRQE